MLQWLKQGKRCAPGMMMLLHQRSSATVQRTLIEMLKYCAMENVCKKMCKEIGILLHGVLLVVLPLFKTSPASICPERSFVCGWEMIPRITQINSSFKHSPASRLFFRVPYSGSWIRFTLRYCHTFSPCLKLKR